MREILKKEGKQWLQVALRDLGLPLFYEGLAEISTNAKFSLAESVRKCISDLAAGIGMRFLDDQ